LVRRFDSTTAVTIIPEGEESAIDDAKPSPPVPHSDDSPFKIEEPLAVEAGADEDVDAADATQEATNIVSTADADTADTANREKSPVANPVVEGGDEAGARWTGPGNGRPATLEGITMGDEGGRDDPVHVGVASEPAPSAGDPWEIDALLEEEPPSVPASDDGLDRSAKTPVVVLESGGSRRGDGSTLVEIDTGLDDVADVGSAEVSSVDSEHGAAELGPPDSPDQTKPIGLEAVGVDEFDSEPDLGSAVLEPRDRTWVWRAGAALWAGLIVAVAVAAAILTVARLPDVKRAESDVIVRLSGFDFSEIDRQLDSYVVVAESEAVLGPAARELGMSTTDLRDAMTVGLVGESAVIRFGVEQVDAEMALVANAALVEQYLLVVNTPSEPSLLVFVHAEIADTESSLAEIAASLDELARRRSDNAARRAGLLATQDTLRGRLVSLYARRTDITTGPTVPGTSLSTIQEEIEEVETQLESVTSEVEQIEADDAADAADETQQLAEQAALRSDLARLQDRRVGLNIDQLDEARARMLTSPHMIEGSVTASTAQGVAFGLAVGSIVAVAFLVVVFWIRRRQ
jgi:Asp-tRNA(Asn)/Glu-tRNA(Gln) amidotransferase C subunit